MQVYNTGDGSLVDDKVVDQGTPATVAGLTVTFDRETQFTGLNVARDPGVPLVWVGALLLFVRVRDPVHCSRTSGSGAASSPARTAGRSWGWRR